MRGNPGAAPGEPRPGVPAVSAPAAEPPRLAAVRPPWTKRLRPGHWMALDTVAAVLFGLIALATLRSLFYVGVIAPWHAHLWLPFLIAIAISLAVALRRKGPLTAFAVVLAAAAATTAIRVKVAPLALLPVIYVLYLVATTSRRKVAIMAAASVLCLLLAETEISHLAGLGVGDAIPVGLLAIIACVVGYAVRQRRAYAAGLREQAASSAVTEERLRIARELHDVVAHSMTVIAVQAGFGQYVIDTDPAAASAALGVIQATSREGLAEMQHMLGVLREAAPVAGPGAHAPDPPAAPSGAPLVPAPGLGDLDRLVARTASAGIQVDLQWKGPRREVPAGVDLSAFRIVQEALTNVVKHAQASSCQVVIGYGDKDLTIEVSDDGLGGMAPAGPGGHAAHNGWPGNGWTGSGAPGAAVLAPATGGHGIVGMRERVNLYQGEFSAGPLPGRGFRVTARLPLGDQAR